MKKTISSVIAIIAVVSLLACAFAVSAFAAEPKLKLTTNTTSNDQTEIIISVTKGSDLATLQAAVKYDPEGAKLMSVEYLSGDQNISNTDTKGVVLINDVWAESLTKAEDIVRLVFSIDSTKGAEISLEDIKATDSNDNPITFSEPKPVVFEAETTTAAPTTEATTAAGNTTTAAGDTTTAAGDTTTTAAATTAAGSNGGAASSNTTGNTTGTSPNTSGKIVASLAGVCAAAAGLAGVVVVVKKKNDRAE